LKDKKVKRLY